MSSKFLDKTGLNTLWAKIKSTFQTLGNLVTAWGSTPSDTKYPSEKLVKTALDGKAASSHTHGNIQNDGKIGTTADYAVVTTTGGAVTATSLATSSPSTSGNTLEFIDTVSQNSKGKISATKKKVTIDSTLSSTSTNPVQNKAVQEAIATHTHTLLSAEPLANAQLPNNSEQTYFKRFYGYVTSYLAAVKLYDVTEFYDGTIVNNYAEHSAFVGDVSFIRTSGISLVSKSKVCMTQGYYSSGARLYGDSARCHPIVLKDSRNVLSSWISGSYIPTGNIGSTVNMTPTTNSNMAHCVIDCASYSTLYVNLSSMTGAPAWTFIDSTNKVIAKASSIAANATLDVPQGAAKIICAIKNAADNKQYSYVAAESATPRYYLALRTDISMGSYMVCEGSFFTRTTATSTISARPLITENFAIINIGGASTALPAGYSVHEDTSYTDVAGTLGTARKLAVSLSNTSTDTTFNGSADVTNIKTTGTLGIGNGGTGATTAIGAEYNILNQVADIDTTIDGNRKIALCNQSKSASNGVFRWLKLSNVWTWIKGLLSSESGVNISGNAATASAAQSGSALETAINAKQDALATQTAYSAKGTATKVPQITTNALGQVTNIEEIDIGYSNSTDLVVGNENNSTPFLLYEISNVGLTQSYTTAVTELMVYLVRSSASTPESATANHMSFKVSIHWQWSLVRTNVEGSLPFGTVTAVLVNSATPAAGSDVSTLKIYLTPENYVSYRVVVTDNRIRGNVNLVRGTITKRGVREAIPTASDLVIVGTTNVMTMQTKENLITSWNSTPSDAKYPSEKLVKTSLDSKVSSIKKNGTTITPSSGVADIGYMPVTEAQATATVQEVIQALRVKPGGRMGSVLLSASTVSSTSIPSAWYNYIWIPHRTGAAADDNQNFGTLILTPMTSTPDVYVIEGSNLNTSSAAYRIKRLGNDASFLYANLAWGGAFRTSLSPFDNYAFKSANCFFGAKPSAIRVEYSTDGGTTWLDYDMTDAAKQQLLSQYGTVSAYCGKNTHIQPGYTGSIVGTKDLSDENIADQRLRITICDSSLANEGTTGSTDRWLYCTLRRIGIYMSTQSASAGVHCLFERRTSANFKSGTDTWVSEGDYKIQGDSGWNSIPCSNATAESGITFGMSDSHTREIRFTIWSDKLSATPNASQTGNLRIYKIVAYSENLWTNNSSNPNVANFGSPYVINSETGVTHFSKGITSDVAIPISSGGTGATRKKAAEYAINGGMAEATAAMQDNFQIVFSQVGTAQNATNGVFLYRQASTVWDYMKGKLTSVSGVNISGNAATATTATNYNTSSGNIKTALDGKSSTSHTHSVSINGSTKTIAASGETAVDLGTYKVFKYARVYATHAYNANTNRYILLAFKSTTYTNNWEESSMFKLVVHDGQFPKEFVFRLWLNGTMSTGVVPADPSDPKLYRVYSENFSESALNILDVRLFVVGKSASSITFTIGIFIDRYYLQARWVSYQLYPLSYGARDRGDTIDNGLSSWTYTVGQDVYSDLYNLFTTAFEVNDLTLDMNVTKARFASNGIFYATYGITTFIEMKVALMEGNVVILRHNGQSILCQSWSDTEIYFAGVTCPEEREPPTLLRFWCYVNTGWSTYPSSYGVCVPVANTVMKTVYMSETVAEWMQIGNLLIGGNGVNGGGIDIRARAVNSSFDCKMDEVIYTNAPGINNGSCVFADRSFSLSSWGLLFQVSQTIGAGQYPAKFTVNLYTKDAIPEHYRIEFHFVSENNYQKVYISAECSRGTEFDDG
ncbi:MAG: hypothetical protein J6T62_04165 [Fibrobacter sp.]|nr:hypothetical protein [Fibrobacter sp.]